MSCDSTYQRRTRKDASAGAARLEKDPKTCICDCAVVVALNSAGTAPTPSGYRDDQTHHTVNN